jgi:hypothetical protein
MIIFKSLCEKCNQRRVYNKMRQDGKVVQYMKCDLLSFEAEEYFCMDVDLNKTNENLNRLQELFDLDFKIKTFDDCPYHMEHLVSNCIPSK